MTARELARGLRAVRQTNDVVALHALAHHASLDCEGVPDDPTDTLLWEIASKLATLERRN